MEMVDEDYAIATSTSGVTVYTRVSPTIDRQLLKTNTSIAMHRVSSSIVMVLPPEADSTITLMQVTEKPDVTYADIGGMDIQKQEIREAVELPLTHSYLYQRIGIDPPRGVLMYGPPGTGKTMMAKAVAHHSSAAFIRVVGSEFVQKYLGEGPRMVRDVFRLAREQQPCIVFIDEVDSIATKRFDASTGADREVQRILLEILTQLDGFDQRTNVSVMMATNRADTLDPALLRPGRLDRKVEFPVPDARQRRLIVGVCLQRMSLHNDVTVDAVVELCNNYSAADITSLCQQAGLLALRANTHVVKIANFEAAARSIKQSQPTQMQFYQ
jgi:26S proteasome regulatory subunit T3